MKKHFSTTMKNGVVLSGTVEVEQDYWRWNPVDYARVTLEGGNKRIVFSRDLVKDNLVSEDLYIETLNEKGIIIDRDLIDVSGGRSHCVDFKAAGEWGEIIRRALASVYEKEA